jgi:hypothetical protein
MPTITIQGTTIAFPNSGASPNWAPAVIEFAQAVEAALEGVSGSFDVSPQTLTINAYNPGTNINIGALNFPVANVKAAYIRYTAKRTTSLLDVVEAGNLVLVYNAAGTNGQKWEISRTIVGPGANITFNVTDSGQVQFSTETLSGINHVGTITFEAKALTTS